MKYKKIALIGIMGCGKTTIAKKLSKSLNIDFYDTDALFEKQNKIEIKDFFKKYGEDKFRKSETEILKDIVKRESFVLSTGGGIILSEENRNLLFCNDILTIYLKTKPKTIMERLKDDKTRPLLFVDNPLKKLEEILYMREKFYSMANTEIETDAKTIDEIEKEIVNYENN